MNRKILEICCFSPASAIIAAENGADRIELCRDQSVGGLTPSVESIKETLSNVRIPVNVMIRVRGGDFAVSQDEFEQMKREIQEVRGLGANGIVIGILDQQGNVDVSRMKEAIALAGPLEVTFHKAFDVCADPFAALEQLADLGVKRILTSGQAETALSGIEVLKKLVEVAGNRMAIMPGGGVRDANLEAIAEGTGAKEFHSSAITQSDLADADVVRKMAESLKKG